jgi:hypothetical protein
MKEACKTRLAHPAHLFKLMEERRLRVIENRVLERIFVPKRDEVTGYWSKLNNEELIDSYSSQIIIRVNISRIMR